MDFDPQASLIVVRAEMRGELASAFIDMALDTGATYVVIPWEVAESLGYDPAASRQAVNLATASSVETAPLITLRHIRALGVEARDVEALCHDLPPASGVKGLLGLSFLKHFDIDLHFKRGVLQARGP